MKICFIAHLRDLSGANRSLIDLASELNNKYDVTVIVPHAGALKNRLHEMGIRTKTIFSGTWVYMPNESEYKKLVKRIVNFLAEIRYFLFFCFHKFDIVHFNSSTYGCGAKSLLLLKRKYTWHIRELAEATFGLRFFDKRKSLELINNANKVIAISKFIKDSMSFDINPEHMVVVHNGISINSLIQRQEIKEGIPSLVLIGAINKDKGQLESARALDILVNEKGYQDLKLYLVGGIIDEEYFQKIKTYAKQRNLQDNLVFTGLLNDVSEYRNGNYIALLCSENEAFGRVIIEAMANYQIIICSDTGACKEIISDQEDGFIYKYGDANVLAGKIERVIQLDEDQKNKILAAAFKKVESRFTIERTAKNVLNVFESVIQG